MVSRRLLPSFDRRVRIAALLRKRSTNLIECIVLVVGCECHAGVFAGVGAGRSGSLLRLRRGLGLGGPVIVSQIDASMHNSKWSKTIGSVYRSPGGEKMVRVQDNMRRRYEIQDDVIGVLIYQWLWFAPP